MSILIEKVMANELVKVGALYDAACEYLSDKAFNPGWRKGIFPTQKDAENYLNHGILFAAKEQNRIVGAIALTDHPDAENYDNITAELNQTEIYIHVLAVHPNDLNKGIGSKLLQFAEEYCLLNHRKVIRLYVYEKNDVAIKAYEKNGYLFVKKEDIGLKEYGLEWFYLYEKVL